MESLSADSPTVKTMIADLTELSKTEASMDGDTAEFRLPNVIHVVVGRGGDTEEEDADDRVIRFSRINGAWRFFDNNAKTVEELDAALKRDAKGRSQRISWWWKRSAATGGCCSFPACPRLALLDSSLR